MVLYLATDALIPTSEPSPASLLAVREIGPSEETVRDRFTKQHVRFLSAYGGCSCPFLYDPASPSSESTLQLLAELRKLLERHLADDDDAELFYCWEGDQGRQPQYTIDAALEDLGTDACVLKTTQLYRVRRRRRTRS